MAATHSNGQEGNPPEEFLPADRVREIVLVRAFEEADPEGRLLPLASRTRASKEAREDRAAGTERSGADIIADRATWLARVLREKFSVLDLVHRVAPSALSLNPLIWIGALVIGLSLNALGPSKQINVLSFPLLFVILWNLLVYLALLVERLRHKSASSPRSPLRTPLGSFFGWASSPERFWRRLTSGFEHEQHVTDAVRRFAASWWRVGQPLHRARLERAFHAGSALVALGTVLGMYVRGLALSYDLTWESTFLDREQVQALISTVLWPADQLLGLGTELGEAGQRSPAAPWIHLYAVTALLFVVLPRTCLFLLATRRANRLEKHFRFDTQEDGYYLRLLASDRGQGVHASIWSYSYRPSKLAEEGLQALLLDVFGNRARLDFAGNLEYGAEWSEANGPNAPAAAACIVLIFNAAQSPEQEVHGHFLEGARAAVEHGDSSARVLVLVDETRYRARLGEVDEGERRLAERRRAWERLVKEAGLRVAFLALEAPAQLADIEHVREAVQNAREVAVR